MAGLSFDGGTKVAEFVTASRPVDIIQGPLGSGKTQAMCARIIRHAQEQMKSPIDGIRYTKWAVVRNTLPDLKRLTIPTWLRVVPERIHGKFTYGMNMHHDLKYTLKEPIGTVHCWVDFFSLDKEDDVVRLRGGEYTGIAFNELSFIMYELFTEARSRLRYPPPEHGGPHPWRGVIADTNAPDEDHWLGMMTGQVELPIGVSEEDRRKYQWPPEWGFYMQPPALIETRDDKGRVVDYVVNPKAENLKNLPDIHSRQPGHAYYADLLIGNPSKAWIDSRLRNEVALVVDGQPVWPDFRREFHVSREALKPVPNRTVTVALDFGRVYPAALFAQEIGSRLYVQYEILGFNEPTTQFAPKVKRFLETHYAGCDFRCVGDPKGQDRGRQMDQSDYDIFKFNGMPVTAAPCPTNDIKTRTEAVADALNDNPRGVNNLVLSPVCRTLIVGMAGRYHLVREETGEFKPKKDKYSNLCDCLQYMVLGLGRGRTMVGLKPIGELRPMRVSKQRTMRRILA